MIRDLLVSLRPGQWVKSGFVFVAPLFARRLTEPEAGLPTLAAGGLFCLAASGVYLLNDLADRERDRGHPRKRERPIAAGRLGARPALSAALLLAGAGVAGGFLVGVGLGTILLVYVAVQVGYSLGLRSVVLLDVFCIASGFVLRVLAGAVAAHVFVSSWLILTTIFLSLFLALCKRRAEVALLAGDGGANHRATLEEYEPAFLDKLITISAAGVVLCYSLYTLDERTVRVFHTRNLVLTVPFLLFGVFRYLFLVHRREGGGSPTSTVLRDVPLLATLAAFGLVTLVVLYVRGLPSV